MSSCVCDSRQRPLKPASISHTNIRAIVNSLVPAASLPSIAVRRSQKPLSVLPCCWGSPNVEPLVQTRKTTKGLTQLCWPRNPAVNRPSNVRTAAAVARSWTCRWVFTYIITIHASKRTNEEGVGRARFECHPGTANTHEHRSRPRHRAAIGT